MSGLTSELREGTESSSRNGSVKLTDHNLTRPQLIVVVIFLNILYCVASHLVIINLTMSSSYRN